MTRSAAPGSPSTPFARLRRRIGAGVLPLAVLCSLVPVDALDAQALGTPTTGPVIEDFGPVFDVPFLEVETDTEMIYRVVFEVAETSANPGDVNPYIESVARFLNMQARAGVPLENMQLALVLHGSAAKDALAPLPFQERWGTSNRNIELLAALGRAGVEIYMCGQSAMSRGLHDDDLVPEVQMALSAMTAIAMLKERGFREVN